MQEFIIRLINKTGSLFRQKTKIKSLSDAEILIGAKRQDYYFNCFHYIHQNPYRAGLVKKLEDWEFSSFKDYAGLRNGTLCNKELGSEFCSYDPKNFIKTSHEIIADYLVNEFL